MEERLHDVLAGARAPDYDETGAPSRARILLTRTWWLIAFVTVAAVLGSEIADYYIALLGTVFSILVLWVAGPRVAKYISPVASAWASRTSDSMSSYGFGWGRGPVMGPPDDTPGEKVG